jgi:hypothetical protein
MQRLADLRNHSETEKLFLRIGFQTGPVLLEKEDVFGDTVNTAARVVAEAFRERILTTRATAEGFPPGVASLVRPWYRAALKGKEALVDLVELTWREEGGTVVQSKTSFIPLRVGRVKLDYRGKEWLLQPSAKPIKFGRSDANEIVIDDPSSYVSNSHGQIEIRGGIAEVVDTSRNGIYVIFDGEPSVRVAKRLALHSSGKMTIGRPPSDPQAIVITFVIE